MLKEQLVPIRDPAVNQIVLFPLKIFGTHENKIRKRGGALNIEPLKVLVFLQELHLCWNRAAKIKPLKKARSNCLSELQQQTNTVLFAS
jgi:hypothetical protein